MKKTDTTIIVRDGRISSYIGAVNLVAKVYGHAILVGNERYKWKTIKISTTLLDYGLKPVLYKFGGDGKSIIIVVKRVSS